MRILLSSRTHLGYGETAWADEFSVVFLLCDKADCIITQPRQTSIQRKPACGNGATARLVWFSDHALSHVVDGQYEQGVARVTTGWSRATCAGTKAVAAGVAITIVEP